MSKLKIGFIGQGWIGKNYADDFEKRGFDTVRYSLEEPYIKNKNKIKDCEIVFIAVPTLTLPKSFDFGPAKKVLGLGKQYEFRWFKKYFKFFFRFIPTTPRSFDFGPIKKVLDLVGEGKIAVLKSTILPGTTEFLQKMYKNIFVLHSPEFLTEATAAFDAGHPDRNIIGVPENNKNFIERAELVLSVLPKSPYNKICSAKEAEFVKYGGNCFFYTKVIFMNLVYDLAKEMDCSWDVLSEMLSADPRIGKAHMNPVHKGGRGGGGHCFIKDFAAFVGFYKKYKKDDKTGLSVLLVNEKKNIELLVSNKKDLDLLTGVYGKSLKRKK